MTEKIPKQFINELLSNTNIVEIINNRIKLKKHGKNYYAKCPFHTEKTPSFTVSNEKQFYYCFGCNSHGNAIDFLMNYEHLNFIETIEEISQTYGIRIPYLNTNLNQERNEFYKRNLLHYLMNNLSHIYEKNINSSSTNAGLKYLLKRGISLKIIKDFSIGFSTSNIEMIVQYFTNININIKTLIKYKILYENEKGHKYDPFKERIIFPIRNKYGKINGFGARTINKHIYPKYLNSSENRIFQKRRQLYGLFEAKKYNKKLPYLLIVEGYLDVITLAQFNIKFAVASLGNSTTFEQMQLLFRASNNIIYCYDGDCAGKEGSWKALKTALPFIKEGKTIKFIFLPKNEDPDSIIQKEGKEKFEIRINNATDMSQFFFKTLLKNINLSSIDDRVKLSSIAIPLIDKITNKTMRIYFRQKLGNILGILHDSYLETLLQKKIIYKSKKSIRYLKQTTMRILIGLLVQNPSLIHITPSIKNLQKSKILGLPLFLEIFNVCKINNIKNTGQLLEFYRNSDIEKILRKLAIWDHMITKEKVKEMFLDTIQKLYHQVLEQKQDMLIAKERTTGLNKTEKNELWLLNQKLVFKHKNII